MVIDLPRKFERDFNEYSFARIRNGVLELKGDFNFEKIMVELAYVMRGRTQCHYCHRKVRANKITIDHMFPSDFGGVTITNNLVPACGTCNSQKSNMNQYEFRIWKNLDSKEEKRASITRLSTEKTQENESLYPKRIRCPQKMDNHPETGLCHQSKQNQS